MTIRAYFEHIGTDFRMDSAFLRRTGVNHGMVLPWYNFHPKSKKFNWLKQIHTFIQYQFIHDLNTGADDFILKLSLDGRFSRSAMAGIHFVP
jgi:hypothetical protein